MRYSLTSLDIGLSSWIVQDGNYPDFRVGQTAEFAVEFWVPEGLAAEACDGPVCVNRVEGSRYNTVADVVLATGDITVLDIGVLVYRESSDLQSHLAQGSRFAVPLELEVDPYFYFERLGKVAGIPPLVYSWKVLSIQRQTAPFIEEIA